METSFIDQIINSITQYFYVEYAVAVWAATATLRFLFRGIDGAIHPKWITFIVGVLVGLATFSWKQLHDEAFVFYKALTSLGAATMGYDYVWKPMVDYVKGRFEIGKTHR